MTTTPLADYLRRVRNTFLSTPHLNEYILVCGNEAADLDSVLCTLSFAYVFQTWNGRPLLPFINCAIPSVLQMRGEIQLALTKLHITQDLVLLSNDVLPVISKAQPTTVQLVMLDHNVPTPKWSRYFDLSKITIVSIVDHHVDEGMGVEAVPRIISPCGSNTSLLVNYISQAASAEQKERMFELQASLALAIIFDTINLTWCTTPADFAALATIHRVPVDGAGGILAKVGTTILAELDAAAIDEANFTIDSLLYKDYKFYTGNLRHQYGISALRTSFNQLIQSVGSAADLTTKIYSFMEREQLDHFILAIIVRPDLQSTQCYRQLGIFCREEIGDYNRVCAAVKDCDLVAILEGQSFGLFEQKNLKIARKQLQPLMQRYLAESARE